MFRLPFFPRRLDVFLTLVLLTLPGVGLSAGTATWQGDSGRWASNHWGLNASGEYPGDPDNKDTSARIAWEGAEVTIDEGDFIDLAKGAMISAGDVKQTGGSAVFGQRLDVRGRYTLTGGTLTSNVTWVLDGGIIAIHGGEFMAPDGEFRFLQNEGTLTISGGRFEVRNLFLAENETSQATLRVVGSAAVLDVTTLVLHPKGGSSTAEFVFDQAGISSWNIRGGGGALKLSAELEKANLTVDVGACRSEGSEGFALFRFSAAHSLVGTFGQVTVNHGTTPLKPTSRAVVQPGEYHLDLGGNGREILLYFHNAELPPVPPPTSD